VVIPFGCQSISTSKWISFADRYGKTSAIIWTTSRQRPDAILDKARCGEELQPSERQGNIARTLVLIMVIACSKGATVQTLGQHRPDAALFSKEYQHFLESRLYS
jgi:hypothetical protein